MSPNFNLLIQSFQQTDPIFWVLGILILLSALCVICQKNLVMAGISLMFCLASLALLYFSLGAQFVALSQILIYAVGIGLLIIFSIMLLNNSSDEPITEINNKINWKNIGAFIGCNLLFAVMSISFMGLSSALSISNPALPKSRIQSLVLETDFIRERGFVSFSSDNLIKFMLSDQILAFELISILLLVAFISAIVISRKIRPNAEAN